jgi:hypothetical protein
MFAWLYEMITSLVYFVLGLFGIQLGATQEANSLLEQEQGQMQEPKELVVETILTEDQAL